MFPQILLSVDDDRLLNSNHTCWHSAYLTYDSMFLLCLIAHLCPLKSLDYRINGAFRAWRPPEFLWTHLKYLFSGILTRGISDSMCHSINAFEIAISFFHLSVSHNFNRLLHALCKSQTLLLWGFILFLSLFWAFFFQNHNPCLFSYYDLFLDQFYHNFTITSIVFLLIIYPFYSRRFVTLFALFYFCSTKLNCYKWFFGQLLSNSHRLILQ